MLTMLGLLKQTIGRAEDVSRDTAGPPQSNHAGWRNKKGNKGLIFMLFLWEGTVRRYATHGMSATQESLSFRTQNLRVSKLALLPSIGCKNRDTKEWLMRWYINTGNSNNKKRCQQQQYQRNKVVQAITSLWQQPHQLPPLFLLFLLTLTPTLFPKSRTSLPSPKWHVW